MVQTIENPTTCEIQPVIGAKDMEVVINCHVNEVSNKHIVSDRIIQRSFKTFKNAHSNICNKEQSR